MNSKLFLSPHPAPAPRCRSWTYTHPQPHPARCTPYEAPALTTRTKPEILTPRISTATIILSKLYLWKYTVLCHPRQACHCGGRKRRIPKPKSNKNACYFHKISHDSIISRYPLCTCQVIAYDKKSNIALFFQSASKKQKAVKFHQLKNSSRTCLSWTSLKGCGIQSKNSNSILARNFDSISIYIFLARDFAHLARPKVCDEQRRIVIRRASSTGREHSQGTKLPLKTGGVLADTSSTCGQARTTQ